MGVQAAGSGPGERAGGVGCGGYPGELGRGEVLAEGRWIPAAASIMGCLAGPWLPATIMGCLAWAGEGSDYYGMLARGVTIMGCSGGYYSAPPFPPRPAARRGDVPVKGRRAGGRVRSGHAAGGALAPARGTGWGASIMGCRGEGVRVLWDVSRGGGCVGC